MPNPILSKGGIDTVQWTSNTPKAGGGVYVIVTDNITPQLQMAQRTLPGAIRPAAIAGAQQIKDEVLQSYGDAMFTSIPNTIATKVAKGGFPTLVETGSLLESINNMKVEQSYLNKHYVAKVTFQPPEAGTQGKGGNRADSGYIYLWSHEFGTRNPSYKFGHGKKFTLKRRPFLKRGLVRGYAKAYATIDNAWLQWYKNQLAAHEMQHYPVPTLNMQRETRISLYDIGMAVAPPTKYYAYMGASSDIIGYTQGSFSLVKIDSWLIAMAKGRGGATKKVQKRNLRRRLWYGGK